MSVGARGPQKQPALLAAVSVILFVASFVGWARQGDPPISVNKPRYPRTDGSLSAAGAAPQGADAHDLDHLPPEAARLDSAQTGALDRAGLPVQVSARVRCALQLSSGAHLRI